MKIVFWSGTGNTEKMASVIADGIVKNEPEDTCEECLAFGMAIAKA